MDVRELEEEFDLVVESRTEEGHSHTTFIGSYRGKSAVIKHSEDARAVREKEALDVTRGSGVETPEVLNYAERNGDHVLITGMVDSEFPGRELWNNPDFCKKLVRSVAETLGEMRSTDVVEKASETVEIRENRDRALKAMKAKNHKIGEEVEGDIPGICEAITAEIDSKHVFTHGDFSTENILLSENGVEAVIDWAEAGFTSRLRDIALFESGFIDEYIRFFHPEKAEEIRHMFRSNLDIDDTAKLELYRFHQNAVVLAYIRKGKCSEEWLKVGSVQEIENHREKVLEQDLEQAKQALKKVKNR